MAMRTVYIGRKLKLKTQLTDPIKGIREPGDDSDFCVMPDGTVYDDQESGRRKVGKMDAKGKIHVTQKYLDKHGERLEQIESRIP